MTVGSKSDPLILVRVGMDREEEVEADEVGTRCGVAVTEMGTHAGRRDTSRIVRDEEEVDRRGGGESLGWS